MKYKDGKKEILTSPHIKIVDTQYLHLFHIQLLAGTNLIQSDTTNSILINEAYRQFLGFKKPADAVGKVIEWQNKQIPIAGVVANFHQKSLREKIEPLVMAMQKNQARAFCVALQPQNSEGTKWKSAIDKIQLLWKEQYPEEDFNYEFLDESIAKYYKSEQNISRLLNWATGLTIFISCLGLLGLVSFVTNQRTKEIGVRKVLGATVSQIVTLLSVDFLKLVLLAFLIAIPIAWWGVHRWLENFAYKTPISIWLFLEGGLFLFSLSILILGIKTYQAANANPVTSLRSE
jgi:ABC-type antimicrobial peptide transport system permease subunit